MKRLRPIGILCAILLAAVLSGCGNGNNGGPGTPAIYVGGYCVNANGATTACYWDASGKRYDLDGDEPFQPNWLCLSFYNNDIYVAGYYFSNGSTKIGYYDTTGRYYLYDLVDADHGSNVYCGFVYNGQVYTGGSYYSGSQWFSCYWDKDGRHDLPAGNVGSIFVDDSGVYAAGTRTDSDGVGTACYWKPKGEQHERHDIGGAGSKVTQIVVANNRVYMSGKNSSGACYWVIDGETVEEYSLGDGEATSIFVSNNQVYVGGWYSDGEKGLPFPCYWVGTKRYSLANPDGDCAAVSSIFVYDNKVYAAGSYGSTTGEEDEQYACYWDETGRHELDVDDSKGAWTECILVR